MCARLRILLPSIVGLLNSPALHAETPNGGATAASVESWTEVVNARLEKAITAPEGVEGTTTALVRRTDEGRVTVVRITAANPHLTEATRATLSRIRRLPPMPAGIDPDTAIKVNLLFGGKDERSYLARRREMFAAASQANRKLTQRLGDTSIALSSAP